jgi:phage baseplate assembly protein gpV
MVFRDTGQPFAAGPPCVRRGATIGYDPAAHRLAVNASADPNLVELSARYADEDKARQELERLRWPNDPVCPRSDCGAVGDAHRIISAARSKTRKGLWRVSVR